MYITAGYYTHFSPKTKRYANKDTYVSAYKCPKYGIVSY